MSNIYEQADKIEDLTMKYLEDIGIVHKILERNNIEERDRVELDNLFNNELISLNSKIVRIETKSFGSRGTGNWYQYSFLYYRPFTIIPLVSIIPTSPFSTEDIHLLSYDLNGVTFRVYESNTSFDYSVRVFVIGY